MSSTEFTIYIQLVDTKCAPTSIKNVTKIISLRKLKERIAEVQGMPFDQQQLMLDGNFMIDDCKIMESYCRERARTNTDFYARQTLGVLWD
jgi:Ubiquitin family